MPRKEVIKDRVIDNKPLSKPANFSLEMAKIADLENTTMNNYSPTQPYGENDTIITINPAKPGRKEIVMVKTDVTGEVVFDSFGDILDNNKYHAPLRAENIYFDDANSGKFGGADNVVEALENVRDSGGGIVYDVSRATTFDLPANTPINTKVRFISGPRILREVVTVSTSNRAQSFNYQDFTLIGKPAATGGDKNIEDLFADILIRGYRGWGYKIDLTDVQQVATPPSSPPTDLGRGYRLLNVGAITSFIPLYINDISKFGMWEDVYYTLVSGTDYKKSFDIGAITYSDTETPQLVSTYQTLIDGKAQLDMTDDSRMLWWGSKQGLTLKYTTDTTKALAEWLGQLKLLVPINIEFAKHNFTFSFVGSQGESGAKVLTASSNIVDTTDVQLATGYDANVWDSVTSIRMEIDRTDYTLRAMKENGTPLSQNFMFKIYNIRSK